MRFGSVCSGIEAASVAWRPLGWEAVLELSAVIYDVTADNSDTAVLG
jgi:hypothetical protein